MDIILTYPAWLLLLCLLLGALYAFLLYRFDPKTRDLPNTLRWSLASLRFLLILFISFFLLEPLVRTEETEVEEPSFVIVQDASASILYGGDSAYYAGDFPRELDEMAETLDEELKVRRVAFGQRLIDSIPMGFPEKRTDISRALQAISERYRDRNLSGVVLATDGIYTSGTDPRYLAERVGAPVHTLALGDTTVKKDLIVQEVSHNRYAYLGNRFPLEMVVRGRKAEGERSELTVRDEQGEQLYKEELAFDKEEELKVKKAQLEADSVGLRKYTVRVKPVEDESSLENNERDVHLEVLDSRRQVLILAHAPHPDVRALKWAIESKNSYEAESGVARDFEGDIRDKDLLILHQLPSRDHALRSTLERAEEQDIPVLFVFGAETDHAELGRYSVGVKVQGGDSKLDEASALFEKDFKDFDIGAAGKEAEEWPPLNVPFGDWSVSDGVHSLFSKQVGKVGTDDPLWGFVQKGERKIGLITGEGLWRWRLANMASSGSVKQFDRIVEKSVQFLSSRDDKSRFRVDGDKEFQEDERIVLRAELYDKSYELLNEPEVEMKIIDAEGKEYSFAFSRTSNAYRLDAGRLPVGEYRYEAKVEWEGDTLAEEGVFRVTPVQLESARTVADHGLLYDLSRRTGGEMFHPEDMGAFASRILEGDAASPVRYTQERMSDLIGWKWLFLPLLLLMTLEWGIRKRSGVY